MSIENWSEQIALVELENEPAFSEDMQNIGDHVATHKTHVVLNLSNVSMINSSNVAQMLRLRKQLIEADLKLRLTGINDKIETVLGVMGLDKVFETAADVPSALAGLQLK